MRAWIQLLLRTQPLVPAALLFGAGVVIGREANPSPVVLVCAAALGLCVLRWSRLIGAAAAIVVIGATIYWSRYAVFSEHDLRGLLPSEPAIVSVRGMLAETPQVREFSTNEITSARLRVSELRLDGGEWQKAEGEVMTRTRGALSEEYFERQQIEVSGVIGLPRTAQAPGLFNLRQYLFNQRIFFQLATESPAEWQITKAEPIPLKEKLRRWAKDQLARGLPEDEQVRILWAMTLGWRTAMSGEMAEPFMRTGTMHIIAISGLHVTCITTMLVFLLHLAGIPRHRCAAVVLPLIWAYTMVTGWQSSGVRSALMSTALIAGWALKRPTAMLNSTAAAGVLILVFQPEQLFQAGFQLSFLVVGSIALLAGRLSEAVPVEWRDDKLLPRSLWPRWKSAMNRVYAGHVRPNLIVSAASFVGALPLTAWYFNMFTPISLIANMVAVPLSSLALLFSMLSLIPLPGSGIFGALSWIFMFETVAVAKFFEGLGGYYYVPRPGLPALLLYFTALALLLGWRSLQSRARFAAASVLGILGAVTLWSRETQPAIHVLPVTGSPVWADLPGRENDLLIDCSDEHGFEYGLKRFLRAQGVGTLPNVLLTHGDVDHLGGFEALFSEFRPRRVYTSPHSSRSAAHKKALQMLERAGEGWARVTEGDSAGVWKVVHPGERRFSRAEDNAVVVKGEIEGWRVLVIQDLGRDGQKALRRSGLDLAAEVLILNVPESGAGLDELLDAINPQVAVIGAAAPHTKKEKVLEPLRERGATVFDVASDAALRIEFRPDECLVSAMTGRTYRLTGKRSSTSAPPEAERPSMSWAEDP